LQRILRQETVDFLEVLYYDRHRTNVLVFRTAESRFAQMEDMKDGIK